MKLLSIFLLFFTPLLSFSTNHYLSSTGSNANNGLSPAAPKQTLAQLNTDLSSYVSGDSVLFKRGDVFYGTFTISVAGLIFDAYGTGVNPTITGFTNVTSWTSLGGNIWESTGAVSTLTTCNYVLLNGKTGQIARQPNTGWLTMTSHVGKDSVTLPGLLADYTGFSYVQRTNRTLMHVAPIIGINGFTKLRLDNTKSSIGIDGYGGFIQDGASICDTINEFYFNPSTKTIRVYSTVTPVVQLSTIDNLINLNAHNLTFKNLDVTGANKVGIYKATGLLNNILIRKCNFTWMGNNAIDFRPNNCLIDSNSITEIKSYALRILNGNVTVADNFIKNTGLIPGASIEDGGAVAAVQIGNAQRYQTTKYSFIRNQIINTGHNPINLGFDTGYVAYNRIDSFNLLTDDGGGIYGATNATIEYNTITNGLGTHSGTNQTTGNTIVIGIYIDDNNTNDTIRYNTVIGASWAGIYLHNSDSSVIVGNKVQGRNFVIRLTADGSPSGRVCCNLIKQNVLSQTDSTASVINFRSILNDINNFAILDSNIYNRVGITDSSVIGYSPLTGGSNLTIQGWRALFGQDINSSRGPLAPTVGAIDFQTNYSASPFTYNFSGVSKKNAFSTVFNNSAVIAAWMSDMFFATGAAVGGSSTRSGLFKKGN